VGEILNSIIFFIIAIGALITFHEYGHFWVARKLGVTVLRFSIGFGPTIWSYTRKNSLTEFVIAAIPLGGYVKMLDESQDKVSEDLLPTAFNRQPLYKRSAIVAAGPLANFLLAAILYGLVFAIGTEGIRPVVGEIIEDSAAQKSGFMVGDELVAIDGRSTESWDQHHFHVLNMIVSQEAIEYEVLTDGLSRTLTVDFADFKQVDLQSESVESIIGMYPRVPLIQPIIGDVVSGYPAEAAGLLPGDKIIQINGQMIDDWKGLVAAVSQTEESMLVVTFLRGNETREVMIQPRTIVVDDNEYKQIGIKVNAEEQLRNSDLNVTVRSGPVEAVVRGFETMWSTTALTVKMLLSLLQFNQSADAIGGPIAIAEFAGKAAQAGVNNYLTFLALLSISLGILNLLPIPVLDGGHLMFHVYEALMGSPPTERMLIWANQVGFALLIGLMGLAFYNDLSRIF
jgi:regulator of sigma E protease